MEIPNVNLIRVLQMISDESLKDFVRLGQEEQTRRLISAKYLDGRSTLVSQAEVIRVGGK